MRPFLELWEVDHTHDPGEDDGCVGNPSIVHEEVLEEFLGKLDNVDRQETQITGDLHDDVEPVKHFTCKRIMEEDDTLTVDERLSYEPGFLRYTTEVQPNWDAIPEAVKEDSPSMNALSALQGKIETDKTVGSFLGTLGVINCRVADDGTVSGYDLESQSVYIYHPIEDTRRVDAA